MVKKGILDTKIEFEKLPFELQSKIIQQIRQRKGLSENA